MLQLRGKNACAACGGGSRVSIARLTCRLDSGAAAAEFALLLPVLLLLFFGIVQYGLMFFTYNNMNNAAREGARALAVGDVDAAGAKSRAEGFLLDWTVPHATVQADVIPQSGINYARVRITMPGSEAGLMKYAPAPAQISAQVLMREE